MMFNGSLDQRKVVCKMQDIRKLYDFRTILKTRDRKTDIVVYRGAVCGLLDPMKIVYKKSIA